MLINMTQKLQELIRKAEMWPREVQDEAADALHAIEMAHRGLYKFTAEDKKALKKSAEDVRLGRFVSNKKLRDFFKTGRA